MPIAARIAWLFSTALMISFNLVAAPTISSLEAVRKTFQGKKGFEAEFSQKIEEDVFLKKKSKSKLNDLKDHPASQSEATGSVRFTRPHFLIWKYEKPSPRKIEYDGKSLKTTDGKDEQVSVTRGELDLQSSFSFLWGETEQNLFTIENIDSNNFRLKPKKKSEQLPFQFIDVKVQGGFVREAKVHNALEGVSTLEFRNWKLINR